MHALSTDSVEDAATRTSWAGYCLTFVSSAYLDVMGVSVSPINRTNATNMYTTYKNAGLVKTTWSTKAGSSSVPPRGAFVFYPSPGFPWSQPEGHIAISLGDGYVVSARGTTYNPYIQKQKYNNTSVLPGYKGWAFPKNASQ
jgi:hypothetical protein